MAQLVSSFLLTGVCAMLRTVKTVLTVVAARPASSSPVVPRSSPDLTMSPAGAGAEVREAGGSGAGGGYQAAASWAVVRCTPDCKLLSCCYVTHSILPAGRAPPLVCLRGCQPGPGQQLCDVLLPVHLGRPAGEQTATGLARPHQRPDDATLTLILLYETSWQ